LNTSGQEDSLAAVNGSNALVQGADATETAPVATTMRQNYTQILGKTVKVAETTDAVSRYGRAKELAYQLGKFSKEVKRDLETIITKNQSASAGNSGAAANMATYSAQIDAGLVNVTGGAGTAMTETLLNTTLQELYTEGAEPNTLMIPPGEALNLASYLGNTTWGTRTREINTSDTKLVNVLEVYVSPFGEVKVILNRFIPAADHLVFDPANWKLAVLRPWTRETLAKTGDATKVMIVGEFSLKHNNQKASAVVRKST
jgi:hypothetical protein